MATTFGARLLPLIQLRNGLFGRSMLVLVKFPHDADKNTQAAGTLRLYGLRRKRLCWEFFGLSCREDAGHDEVSGR